MNIKIPDEVQYIFDTLESGGFEAYAVGGCVRDSLLGKTPQDWDVCTSALPEQTKEVFAGRHIRIVETGLRHGTVTLMLNHKPFEVTSYRVDGKYTDNRRPDKVEFVSVLKRDLARRDFSINAMAYNPKTGLSDCFGGRRDLRRRLIKCVGDPDKRFQEDALRIMRALRFASVLGFTIEDGTAQAMRENKSLLKNIAAERIAAELNKLIMGDGAGGILSAYLPVLAEIIPEFTQTAGTKTFNFKGVDAAPKDLVIRLTMMLRNIYTDKPKRYCYTESAESEDGNRNPQDNSDTAYTILSRLKYDNETIKAVAQLVSYSRLGFELEFEIKHRQHIKRWLNKTGEKMFRQLLEIKKAESMAQPDIHKQHKQLKQLKQETLDSLRRISAELDEIIARRQCFSLKDLAVNGRDLIEAGVPEGIKIGVILNRLMDMVIDEKAENDRAVLLGIAMEISGGQADGEFKF